MNFFTFLKLILLLLISGMMNPTTLIAQNKNHTPSDKSYPATEKQLKRIFFNLYVDSIKPVMRYYVNVDGEFSDGSFLPMDHHYITLTANQGTMEGNDWIAPKKIDFDAVTFTAISKSPPYLKTQITVPMRQTWDDNEGVLEKKDVMK